VCLANDALGDGLDVIVLGSRQRVEEGTVGGVVEG